MVASLPHEKCSELFGIGGNCLDHKVAKQDVACTFWRDDTGSHGFSRFGTKSPVQMRSQKFLGFRKN